MMGGLRVVALILTALVADVLSAGGHDNVHMDAYGFPQICQGVGCDSTYDVALIVDRSERVGNGDDYEAAINAALSLFDIGSARSRIGLVVAHDDDARVDMLLNEDNNEDFIKDYISQSLPVAYGGFNLVAASQKVRTEIFTATNGDRSSAQNICILFADGGPTVDVAGTDAELQLLRTRCIVVVVSGNDSPAISSFLNDASSRDRTIISSLSNLKHAVKDDLAPLVCMYFNFTADCSPICCQNGGTPTNALNGCCKCACPDHYSGTYCQDSSKTNTIAKYTYENGTNVDWYLEMSTEDKSHHPIRKSLERRRKIDPYDNHASFSEPDPYPVYTLHFRGSGVTNLHYLQGQFATRYASANVVVTAFNGATAVLTQSFALARIGTYNRLGYQDWRIDFLFTNDVTSVVFEFDKPCDRRGCFGINNVFGIYTRVVDVDLKGTCDTCPQNKTPKLDNGCCTCV